MVCRIQRLQAEKPCRFSRNKDWGLRCCHSSSEIWVWVSGQGTTSLLSQVASSLRLPLAPQEAANTTGSQQLPQKGCPGNSFEGRSVHRLDLRGFQALQGCAPEACRFHGGPHRPQTVRLQGLGLVGPAAAEVWRMHSSASGLISHGIEWGSLGICPPSLKDRALNFVVDVCRITLCCGMFLLFGTRTAPMCRHIPDKGKE